MISESSAKPIVARMIAMKPIIMALFLGKLLSFNPIIVEVKR